MMRFSSVEEVVVLLIAISSPLLAYGKAQISDAPYTIWEALQTNEALFLHYARWNTLSSRLPRLLAVAARSNVTVLFHSHQPPVCGSQCMCSSSNNDIAWRSFLGKEESFPVPPVAGDMATSASAFQSETSSAFFKTPEGLAYVLYTILPGSWSDPQQLIQQGSINTLLGRLMHVDIALQFAAGAQGEVVVTGQYGTNGTLGPPFKTDNGVYYLTSALPLPTARASELPPLSTLSIHLLAALRRTDIPTPPGPSLMPDFAAPKRVLEALLYRPRDFLNELAASASWVLGLVLAMDVLVSLWMVTHSSSPRFQDMQHLLQPPALTSTARSADVPGAAIDHGAVHPTGNDNGLAGPSTSSLMMPTVTLPETAVQRAAPGGAEGDMGAGPSSVVPNAMGTANIAPSFTMYPSGFSEGSINELDEITRQDLMNVETRGWLIDINKLHFDRNERDELLPLGKGGYSEVFKGKLHSAPVAIKVASRESSNLMEEKKQLMSEIDLLKELRHVNIVQFFGAYLSPTQIVLVTEFMQGGDLFRALQGRASHNFMWHMYGKDIARDVARGLVFLHGQKKPVVHCDLKSPNVLLSTDNHITAKIADFGTATYKVREKMPRYGEGLTYAWAAPELLTRGEVTEKVDIYSFGVILWEIVTGREPQRGQLGEPDVGSCPPAVVQLIYRCTAKDPEDRPTAQEVHDIINPLVPPRVGRARMVPPRSAAPNWGPAGPLRHDATPMQGVADASPMVGCHPPPGALPSPIISAFAQPPPRSAAPPPDATPIVSAFAASALPQQPALSAFAMAQPQSAARLQGQGHQLMCQRPSTEMQGQSSQ